MRLRICSTAKSIVRFVAIVFLVAFALFVGGQAWLHAQAVDASKQIAVARCQDALDRGRQAEATLIGATAATRQSSIDNAALAYAMARKDVAAYCTPMRVSRIWPPTIATVPELPGPAETGWR